MTQKIIISGFGGQGVLSAGLLIAESAVEEGWNATFFPSYGAEMRGGTANCHVIISDSEIASPIIKSADTLIALNSPSVDKFLPLLKKDGLLLVNSSVVSGNLDAGARKVVELPLDSLALEKLGNSKSANVIIIGAFAKLTNVLKPEKIKSAIEKKFASKGGKIIDMNLRALELGAVSV